MSNWEVPPPGSTWSTPPSGPGAGNPTPPPPPPSPGTTAGPTTGQPTKRSALRLQGLAIAVCVGLALAGLACFAAAGKVSARGDLLDGVSFASLENMSAGERGAYIDSLDEADRDLAAPLGLYVVLVMVTGIGWVVWQRRFVRNAKPLGPIDRTLGWGTWGWLVPFANLYFPQAQLANAARLSDPERTRGHAGAASPVVYCWWAAYTISSILMLGGRWTQPTPIDLFLGTAKLSDFKRADSLFSMGFYVNAVAAGFAIATVLICTRRQRLLLTSLGVDA